jgi:hypothetical protein
MVTAIDTDHFKVHKKVFYVHFTCILSDLFGCWVHINFFHSNPDFNFIIFGTLLDRLCIEERRNKIFHLFITTLITFEEFVNVLLSLIVVRRKWVLKKLNKTVIEKNYASILVDYCTCKVTFVDNVE